MSDEITQALQQALDPLLHAREEAMEKISKLEDERMRVTTEMTKHRVTVNTAERLIRQIDPDRLPAPTPKAKAKVQGASKISDEKYASAETFVKKWFADGHDMIRQSDLILNTNGFTQSTASSAFRRLREDGVLRLVRIEGSMKLYRLTKSATEELTTPDKEETHVGSPEVG